MVAPKRVNGSEGGLFPVCCAARRCAAEFLVKLNGECGDCRLNGFQARERVIGKQVC